MNSIRAALARRTRPRHRHSSSARDEGAVTVDQLVDQVEQQRGQRCFWPTAVQLAAHGLDDPLTDPEAGALIAQQPAQAVADAGQFTFVGSDA